MLEKEKGANPKVRNKIVAEITTKVMTKHSITADTKSQKTRIVAALRLVGPHGLTTIEMRDMLDIMHPGGRVNNLRNDGVGIATVWTNSTNSQGKEHRCGRYVLIKAVA